MRSTLAGLFLLIGAISWGQDVTWIDRTVDGISYSFPEEYQAINSPEATGVAYSADNLYLAVTSLPDTSTWDITDQRARTEYYKKTLTTVLQRLRGRLRVSTDTTINAVPAHYATVEVIFNDTMVTNYDLLQVYQNQKLHAFSCQYEVGDKESLEVRNAFFVSIGDGPAKMLASRATTFTKVAIALGILSLVILVILRARKKERN